MSVFIVGRRHAPAYDDRHLTHAAVIRPLMLKMLMRMLLKLLMLTGAERSRTNSQHLHVNTPSVSQSVAQNCSSWHIPPTFPFSSYGKGRTLPFHPLPSRPFSSFPPLPLLLSLEVGALNTASGSGRAL